jgi:hypothetical protein
MLRENVVVEIFDFQWVFFVRAGLWVASSDSLPQVARPGC